MEKLLKHLKKKGVSPVIATILIIFITVMAVIAVAGYILPMVKKNLSEGQECFDAYQKVVIKENAEYTCFDNIGTEVYLMIENKLDALEFNTIRISLTGAGTSKTYDIINGSDDNIEGEIHMYNRRSDNKILLPGNRGAFTYNFSAVDFDVESAAVAVVLESGNICDAYEILVPGC